MNNTKIIFTALWKEEFSSNQKLTTKVWQKKIGNIFKKMAKLTRKDLLDLHAGETGQLLAILAMYFNVLTLKKNVIDLIIEEMLKTIANSLDLFIDGKGTIAILWNSNIALNERKLITEEYFEKISKFFNELSKQPQKIFPQEVGQLLAYLLIIMTYKYSNPIYHYLTARHYLFKKLDDRLGENFLKRAQNIEKETKLSNEKTKEINLQYFI